MTWTAGGTDTCGKKTYLKIGDTNDKALKGESDYVWALQDGFEVERGEVWIIGKKMVQKNLLY
jgi:lipopolysaccharide transport system ATP-binding protein